MNRRNQLCQYLKYSESSNTKENYSENDEASTLKPPRQPDELLCTILQLNWYSKSENKCNKDSGREKHNCNYNVALYFLAAKQTL
jgi:hypothetical protein